MPVVHSCVLALCVVLVCLYRRCGVAASSWHEQTGICSTCCLSSQSVRTSLLTGVQQHIQQSRDSCFSPVISRTGIPTTAKSERSVEWHRFSYKWNISDCCFVYHVLEGLMYLQTGNCIAVIVNLPSAVWQELVTCVDRASSDSIRILLWISHFV